SGIAGPRSRHVEKRFAILIIRGHPDRQLVVQRNIYRAANSHIIIAAELALDPSTELIQRRIRFVDEYGAAGRVLTGKRALRSAQYFDAGDVVIRLAPDPPPR